MKRPTCFFSLGKPCSHKSSFLCPCYEIGVFFGCFLRLLTWRKRRFFNRKRSGETFLIQSVSIGKYAIITALDHVFTLSYLCSFSATPQAHFSSPACAHRSVKLENRGCLKGCMLPLLKSAMPLQAALHPSHRAWFKTALYS